MNRSKIHLIMPMAGEGSRFKDAGIDIPKPLIEFDGMPLFMNAMKTVDGVEIASKTFIVRKEHIDKYGIDKKILQYVPDAYICAVDKTTRGSAETAFIAIRSLITSGIADFTDSMLIMDCDVIVRSVDWKNIIQHPKVDGVLLSFKSDDPKFSYAAVKHGKVMWTAEKSVISDNALTSPYFITKIEDFVDAFHEMEMYMEGNTLTYKEMYTSIIYSIMAANKKHIILVSADEIISLGTPEELEIARTRNLK